MNFLAARTMAGLSQQAAGEKIGVAAAAVCQWETGKTMPRASLLPKIAEVYGCSVDALLTDDNFESEHTDSSTPLRSAQNDRKVKKL